VGLPFAEALAGLLAPGVGSFLYRFTADFPDGSEIDRLAVRYGEAVAALTGAFGPPLDWNPRVVGPLDIDRVTCWQRPGGLAYVMLWWDDNTRVRCLELGSGGPGDLFAAD